ncbi:MAG: type I-E CRISPR-associated protein Cse1/CasA [bacterium]
MMVEFSFNLAEEPWIPCTDCEGVGRLLSLRDLFSQAHKLRGISPQSPLTEAAFFRVLLAVVHRAVSGPRDRNEWKELYKRALFDDRIPKYLEKWRHRFDLFSPDTPFYQTPGLLVINEKGEPVPQSIASIMLGTASGNNKTLFDHTTADTPVKLFPSEAAMTLITAQMFSLGGLNKKTTKPFGYQQSFLNAVMVNGILILLTGKSLFETLLLNLLVYSDVEPIPSAPEDCPVWERSDVGRTSVTEPKGYLDFLTCKCRHILLVPQATGKEIMVEHIHIAQGEAFPSVPNPGFLSKKNKKGDWYHPQLDVDRLVWRDSIALFSFEEGEDRRPKAFRQVANMGDVVELPRRYVCTSIAFANSKANPLTWRRESLNVPQSLLSDKDVVAALRKGMSIADNGEKALRDAAKKYMQKYLPANSKDVSEKVAASGAVRMYWDLMEGHFHHFLRDLDDPNKALEIWVTSTKNTVRDSLKTCMGGRYCESARSYKAWSVADGYLNALLAKLGE